MLEYRKRIVPVNWITYFVESASSCLLSFHLGEVVVVGDQVGHDRLIIRSGDVHV